MCLFAPEYNHFICFQKRVTRVKKHYFWQAIPNTPFTLVVTYPASYGLNRVHHNYEEEIHRINAKQFDLLSFFEGKNWKIHPDW